MFINKCNINSFIPFPTNENAKAIIETKINDEYVTKEMLKGSDTEDEDFIFVTSTQYAKDQESIQEAINQTVKVDSEGNALIDNIVTSEKLTINGKDVAITDNIPVLLTLSEDEYNKLVEDGEINDNTYYYIYDNKNEKLVYVTLEHLEQSYSTTNQTQSWAVKEFYNKEQIDAIIKTLQASGDYVTGDQLEGYYTATQIDDKFFTKEEISETYATGQELENLEERINEQYVTKEMLKGSDTEDDDFMFVTSTKYQKDNEEKAKSFESEHLTTSKISLGDSELIINESRLEQDGEKIALLNEVPKIECITQEVYQELEKEGGVKDDVFYYIYNVSNEDLVYVTLEQLKQGYDTRFQYQDWVSTSFYNKVEIDKMIASLQMSGDYITPDQLISYYTMSQTDALFLKAEDAANTYATIDRVVTLESKLSEEYVTIEMLKGSDTEDDDFIFIKGSQYEEDKAAEAIQFETENLVTSQLTFSENVSLTASGERLLHNGDEVALVKEMPKVECMTESKYKELVTENKIDEGTFYYTFEEDNNAPSGYVQLDYIESNYYSSRNVDDLLTSAKADTSELVSTTKQGLESSIASLDAKSAEMIERLTISTQEQFTNIIDVLLVELENRLQTQINTMQVRSEVLDHTLSFNDNDIMLVQGKTLHILSASKVSVDGLQIVVD